MTNKKKLITYISLALIVVVVLLVLLIEIYPDKVKIKNSTNNNTQDILNETEMRELNLYHLGVYEAISRDANNKVVSYRMVSLKSPKEIDIEFMSNIEKIENKISTTYKIQVLERDENNKVVAYRVIKNYSDILTRW